MQLLLVATGLLEGLGRELANKMCDSASGNLKGPANRSKKKRRASFYSRPRIRRDRNVIRARGPADSAAAADANATGTTVVLRLLLLIMLLRVPLLL